MARIFGTDGVRGLANRDITAGLALELGQAAARYIISQIPPEKIDIERKPKAIIARDTRVSGEFLSHAIAAGLASAGMDVIRIGVLPTPAVAYLMSSGEYELGVMISASHNPMPDNGIKFFAKGGYKLEDQIEDEIQALLENRDWTPPVGSGVGEIETEHSVADHQYIEHLVKACDTPLKGLRIAVDCANGAASFIGPEALRQAGADVVVMNASPDGRNINDDCGSTHPEQLQAVTVASKAAFGVAFDGDADRCLAVDHTGRVIDGDKIMGMLAVGLKKQGRLHDDTLVVTVMSNLGLLLAMKEKGIKVVQTAVGDRYVLEEMLKSDYSLGGEQSGHLINAHHATTGDGILTALMIARDVKRSGKTLAELTDFITRLPQTLINVPNVRKDETDHPKVQEAIQTAQAFLGESGRVLLRPSGTEPLVRVMVEAATQTEADAAATRLADVVAKYLAL